MRISIRTKLFLVLLLTSILVSGGLFSYIQWSFDRGFINYVNRQQLSEMETLLPRLAEAYSRHGNWRFLRENPRHWRQLLSRAPERPLPPVPPEPGAGPGPEPPPGRASHLALLDADKRVVIGPSDLKPVNLKPIEMSGQTIGYLTLVPSRELLEAGDLLFLEEQTQSFALIAIGVAILSLLLSFPLTHHILQPIRALAAGTRRLMAGNYQTRIATRTRDELGQLCEDFNNLAATLEKNEQARRQWVADIAHELRTPLAILQGEVEAFQDGVRPPNQQNLAALHAELLQLNRLVNDLYELSMSDIGALSYKKVPTDALGLLRETLEQFTPRLSAAGLEAIVRLPDRPAILDADPGRLQQLFVNLLENSLRYTDAPGKIGVAARIESGSLFIEIEDSAPAVAAEHLRHLFNRLYRVDPSRSRTTGGAGLGLAICKNIVEAHQGDISAGPSDLGGLKLSLRLPLNTRI